MVVESSLKRGRGSKVGARISCSSPSKMLMEDDNDFGDDDVERIKGGGQDKLFVS